MLSLHLLVALLVTVHLLFMQIFPINGEIQKFKSWQFKKVKEDPKVSIRVMTFNIWNSGINVENGLFKIAKHILYVYPDIVALEEVVSQEALLNLTKYLGPEWSSIGRNMSRPDSAVLTRHEMLKGNRTEKNTPAEENGSTRAKIKLSLSNGQTIVVNFWALHLDYHDYGPYAACNKLVTNAYQIDAGESYLGGDVPGRIQNIHTIVIDSNFIADLKSSDTEPMLVLGDMNCPSHLDWIDDTKDEHCDWTYQWPVTKVLVNAGLKDAFREIYPDPLSVPGTTWSTVQKFQDGWGGMIPEPQDRIDMVFYMSKLLTPVKAKVYSGFEPIKPKPNVWFNDWPSDHASVIVDFSLNVKFR